MSLIENLNIPGKLKKRIEKAIEKRVEARVRARLTQHKLTPEQFSEEELAIIYEDERIKLMDDLKAKGLLALLAALGLSLF